MMNAVSHINHAPVYRASSPAPAQQQTPVPPEEDALDFAVLDTPREVLQLPVMEPVFQLTLGLGVVAGALIGGMGGSVPTVHATIESFSNGNRIHAGYHLHMNEDTLALTGAGMVGENFAADYVTVGEEGISWKGRMGAENETDLRLTVNEETQVLNVQGIIGQVSTNLNMSAITNEAGEVTGFNTTGTLGGERYISDTLFRLPEGQEFGTFQDTQTAEVMVRGHVGGMMINKDYSVVATTDEESQTMSVQATGSGKNAGVDQSVNINLEIRA